MQFAHLFRRLAADLGIVTVLAGIVLSPVIGIGGDIAIEDLIGKLCQRPFDMSAQQLQLVVRYNNSTLEHLASDFKLPAIPSRDDEVIAVRLRVITDATPGDPTDNDEETAWVSHTVEPTGAPRVGKKDVYNYRRYVFDDITMTDDLIGLAVDFYYVGALDAESPITSLFAYYGQAEDETVKLTKEDVNALKEFGN